MLSTENFKTLIEIGSLFAFDLIIRNNEDKILLGLRKNSPGKSFWFVPGGRVFKNETLTDGFRRVLKAETGLDLDEKNISPLGLYDHIYEDNFFGDEHYNTHYIVTACKYRIEGSSFTFPETQHEQFRFWSIDELLNSPEVHQYTKNYFIENAENLFYLFKA